MSDVLQTNLVNGVAEVLLDRPRVHNALDKKAVERLHQVLVEWEDRDDVRVVILSHTGEEYFCTGGDLRSYEDPPFLEYREYLDAFFTLWTYMQYEFSAPILARLHGSVLGGGVGMIAASDLAYASSDVEFECAEINVGLWPMGVMPMLMRNVPQKKGLEMMMLGRFFSAQEAEAMGLINGVYATRSQLEEGVEEIAGELSRKSPVALAMGKRAYYSQMDMNLPQAFKFAADELTLLVNSDQGQEGIKAFLEKRKPQWG